MDNKLQFGKRNALKKQVTTCVTQQDTSQVSERPSENISSPRTQTDKALLKRHAQHRKPQMKMTEITITSAEDQGSAIKEKAAIAKQRTRRTEKRQICTTSTINVEDIVRERLRLQLDASTLPENKATTSYVKIPKHRQTEFVRQNTFRERTQRTQSSNSDQQYDPLHNLDHMGAIHIQKTKSSNKTSEYQAKNLQTQQTSPKMKITFNYDPKVLMEIQGSRRSNSSLRLRETMDPQRRSRNKSSNFYDTDDARDLIAVAKQRTTDATRSKEIRAKNSDILLDSSGSISADSTPQKLIVAGNKKQKSYDKGQHNRWRDSERMKIENQQKEHESRVRQARQVRTMNLNDLMYSRRKTDNALARTITMVSKAVHKPQISFYSPIDMEKYQNDISERKRVLKILQRDRKHVQEELTSTQFLVLRSFTQLKGYHEKYQDEVYKSILMIQRWFRAWRQRQFFKTLLRKEITKQKVKLQQVLTEMQDNILAQKQAMEKKVLQVEEASNRDRVKEQFEAAARMQVQENKALAITKFETVLTDLAQDSLRRVVVQSLQKVKYPLFELEFAEYFREEMLNPNFAHDSTDQYFERSLAQRYQVLVARVANKSRTAQKQAGQSEQKKKKFLSGKPRIIQASPAQTRNSQNSSSMKLHERTKSIISRKLIPYGYRTSSTFLRQSTKLKGSQVAPRASESNLKATIQNALQRRMLSSINSRQSKLDQSKYPSSLKVSEEPTPQNRQRQQSSYQVAPRLSLSLVSSMAAGGLRKVASKLNTSTPATPSVSKNKPKAKSSVGKSFFYTQSTMRSPVKSPSFARNLSKDGEPAMKAQLNNSARRRQSLNHKLLKTIELGKLDSSTSNSLNRNMIVGFRAQKIVIPTVSTSVQSPGKRGSTDSAVYDARGSLLNSVPEEILQEQDQKDRVTQEINESALEVQKVNMFDTAASLNPNMSAEARKSPEIDPTLMNSEDLFTQLRKRATIPSPRTMTLDEGQISQGASNSGVIQASSLEDLSKQGIAGAGGPDYIKRVCYTEEDQASNLGGSAQVKIMHTASAGEAQVGSHENQMGQWWNLMPKYQQFGNLDGSDKDYVYHLVDNFSQNINQMQSIVTKDLRAGWPKLCDIVELYPIYASAKKSVKKSSKVPKNQRRVLTSVNRAYSRYTQKRSEMQDTDEYKEIQRRQKEKQMREDQMYQDKLEEKKMQAMARVDMMRRLGSSDAIHHKRHEQKPMEMNLRDSSQPEKKYQSRQFTRNIRSNFFSVDSGSSSSSSEMESRSLTEEDLQEVSDDTEEAMQGYVRRKSTKKSFLADKKFKICEESRQSRPGARDFRSQHFMLTAEEVERQKIKLPNELIRKLAMEAEGLRYTKAL